VDNRVLMGIAVVALLGLGYIGYLAMNPAQPEVPDDGGETPDSGGETPDTGGETPDTGGETPDTGGETITATVTGSITDDSGEPIEGVLVQIGDVSTTTDSKGEYSLEVSNGTYYVEASKDGYSQVLSQKKPSTRQTSLSGS